VKRSKLCDFLPSTWAYRRRFAVDCLCILFVGDMSNVSLEASFDNMQDWKGILEKAEEVNSTKVYDK
jgi:hypothetical protein